MHRGLGSCRWLVGLLFPCSGIATALAYKLGAGPVELLFAPLLVVFVVIPLIDRWFATYATRLQVPTTGAAMRFADAHCRWILYLAIVLIYLDLLLFVDVVRLALLPWWGYIGVAFSSGAVSGCAILVGHELGHKRSRVDRFAARVALILVGYAHFTIQHNRGHHRQVATPEDCSSARMGENLYRFALREMTGSLACGWRLEVARLAVLGRRACSPHNEVLQSAAASLAIVGALVAWAGSAIIPFLVLHHFTAWGTLSLANYVEHYGLLRRKLPDGRYEPPASHHSWNSSQFVTNLVSFNLPLHSDHHTDPTRPYHRLRDLLDTPRLPRRFPGPLLLAMVPLLWFRVMDPKVIEWCVGDLDKANIDPRALVRLKAMYGAKPAGS
jgi:alkane 1-monooxygenase